MLTFVGVIFVSASLSQASTEISIHRKIIFWSHGIGGDIIQFGALGKIFEKYLPADDSTQIIFYPFRYNTANDKLAVTDFSKQLGAFIDSKIDGLGGLGPEDEIILYGFSQGGLINLDWLMRTAASTDIKDQKVIKHVTHFISVAAPFWGSEIANLGARVKPFLGSVFLGHFGAKQIEDMAVGSDAVFLTARTFALPENKRLLSELTKKISFLQLNGFLLPHKIWNVFLAHSLIDEDFAVANYSTPLNYIYYFEDPLRTSNKKFVSKKLFEATNYPIQLRSVEGWHLTSTQRMLGSQANFFPNYPSLVDIPNSCIDDIANCFSQSANLAVRFLKGQELPQLVQYDRRYSVNFLIHTDAEAKSAAPLKVEFKNPSLIDENVTEEVANFEAFKKYKKHFEGRIDEIDKNFVNFKLEIPGYATRSIDVPVEAGKSTFAELYFYK